MPHFLLTAVLPERVDVCFGIGLIDASSKLQIYEMPVIARQHWICRTHYKHLYYGNLEWKNVLAPKHAYENNKKNVVSQRFSMKTKEILCNGWYWRNYTWHFTRIRLMDGQMSVLYHFCTNRCLKESSAAIK